jgi:hypothetical protein
MKTMKQVLTLSATVLMAALTMTGCGKSDNGTTAARVVGPYGYGSCAGCAANTQVIASAQAQDSLGEGLQLQFYGTSGSTYQTSANGQYTQVAAQGIMIISGQTAMSCGVPPGQYQVTTYQAPGVMTGAQIQNLSLIATGPAQVQLQLNVYFTSPSKMQIRGQMMGQQNGYRPCELVMY